MKGSAYPRFYRQLPLYGLPSPNFYKKILGSLYDFSKTVYGYNFKD